MAWSKVKSAMESNVCRSLRRRLAFHMAKYRTNSWHHGRVWIEVDGEEIVGVKDCEECSAARRIHRELWPRWCKERNEHETWLDYHRLRLAALRDEGIFTSGHFFGAVKEFHANDITSSLFSDDPIVQTLAVIDRRTGKRTLQRLDPSTLHPMALKLYLIRLDAENMRRPEGIEEPSAPFRRLPLRSGDAPALSN